jgi:D-3-phosphoglycerate dehydrogenase / 2-oxoglutarate reductase
MSVNTQRVLHVKYLSHKVSADIFGTRRDMHLAARDELATTYHVTKDLLRRSPKVRIVPSNGAGYDTVNVKHCTEAGVLVPNQADGNRQSVAEHALGTLLCLSKAIIKTGRTMRREAGMSRNPYLGNKVHGKTTGTTVLGCVGRLCRGIRARAFGLVRGWAERQPAAS